MGPAGNHSFSTGNHRTSSPLMGCWPSSIAQLVSTICLGRQLITDFLLLFADFLQLITVLLLLITDFPLVITPFLLVITGSARNFWAPDFLLPITVLLLLINDFLL